MCRLRVSLRFDDPTRNLDAALALQFEIVREYVSINCLDGGEKDLGATLVEHRLDGKGRSIGDTDRMRGNRRLFGRTTKIISRTNWPDPDGLRDPVPFCCWPEASNERRNPPDCQNVAPRLSRRTGAAVFDRSIDRPERHRGRGFQWTGTVTRMRRRS
jgi:hypothetical protein